MAESLSDQVADAGGFTPVPASMLKISEDSTPSVMNTGMESSLDSQVSNVLPSRKEISNLYQQGLKAAQEKEKNAATEQMGEARAIDDYLSRREKLEAQRPERPKETSAPAQPENNSVKQFGSFASMLGIFASAFTKKHIVTALNSSAAAITAQRAGDQDAYEEAYKRWKESTELGLKRYQFDRDSYADAIKDLDTDYAGTIAKVKALGAASNWPALSVLSEINVLEEFGKLQASLDKAAEGTELHKLKMEEERAKVDKIRAQKEVYSDTLKSELATGTSPEIAKRKALAVSEGKSLKDIPTWSPKAIEANAEAYAKGVPLTKLVPGLAADNPNRKAVVDRALEINPNLDIAAAELSFAERTSKARKEGLSAGQLDIASTMLDQTIPLARAAVEKIDLSQFSDLNALDNYYKSHTGDTDLGAARTAIQASVSDYATMLVRSGMSTDTARETAHDLANVNMGKGSLDGFFAQIEKESNAVQNGIDIIEDKIKKYSKRKEDKPADLPEGSKLIGTDRKTGKKVYQAPDGSKFLVE